MTGASVAWPERLARAKTSLAGLSVGDAFGQRFFHQFGDDWVQSGRTPPAPWPYTDDTEMALAVFDVLAAYGRIDQDALAAAFARRYTLDPTRGYGANAHGILRAIASGASWREAALACHDGAGSMGNGAAMRAAPIGAWFADDLPRVVIEATASAAVTHAHADGQAGAIAVAVAAAWGVGRRERSMQDLFAAVLDLTPAGDTRMGIERARDLPVAYDVRTAVFALGNGSRIVSSDTVPLCLWLVARHPQDYFSALWSTVSAGGDRDTTTAIVGGILATWLGDRAIPDEWVVARETLRHETLDISDA